MNIPVDYDDEVERKQTHPALLPKPKTEADSGSASANKPSAPRRSVLGEIQNQGAQPKSGVEPRPKSAVKLTPLGNPTRDRGTYGVRKADKSGARAVTWASVVAGGDR